MSMMPGPFKAAISYPEYCDLLAAPNMLKYNFAYDERTGEIEFFTNDGAALARDLARVIDPGETSWTEILH